MCGGGGGGLEEKKKTNDREDTYPPGVKQLEKWKHMVPLHTSAEDPGPNWTAIQRIRIHTIKNKKTRLD